jgi:regulator of extracellular matrix RemA (YlzA/DUF370 family)
MDKSQEKIYYIEDMENKQVVMTETFKVGEFYKKDAKIGEIICKNTNKKDPILMPSDGKIIYLNQEALNGKLNESKENNLGKRETLENKEDQNGENKITKIKQEEKKESKNLIIEETDKKPESKEKEVDLNEMFDDFFSSRKENNNRSSEESNKFDEAKFKNTKDEINKILGIKKPEFKPVKKVKRAKPINHERILLFKYLNCKHEIIYRGTCTNCLFQVNDMKPQLLADVNGTVELRGEESNQLIKHSYIKQKKMVMILDLDHTVVHAQFLDLSSKDFILKFCAKLILRFETRRERKV